MIADLQPLDLLKLAQAEFARYNVHADSGAYEQFASVRMAQQLVAEAADMMSVPLCHVHGAHHWVCADQP